MINQIYPLNYRAARKGTTTGKVLGFICNCRDREDLGISTCWIRCACVNGGGEGFPIACYDEINQVRIISLTVQNILLMAMRTRRGNRIWDRDGWGQGG